MPKEPVNLSSLLREVKFSLLRTIELHKAIIVSNFVEVDDVITVKNYMSSIFVNLITNSIKYSKKSATPVINISTRKTSTGYDIIFQDNGIGLDMDKYKNKVFGLYNRFHREVAEGTGVGLYLVKLETEILNGTVELHSEVGIGSVFTIHFKN